MDQQPSSPTPPSSSTGTPSPPDKLAVPGQTPSETNVGESAAEDTDQPASVKDGIKGALSTIAILIIAPLIALTLTAFVFQSYEVDGPSMETTLQNQDRLIVYKLPKTVARITGKAYLPHRGDIVIFNRVENAAFGSQQNRQLIKRVVALPGERVVVKNGVITVFNTDHPEGFKPDDAPYGKVIVTTPGDVDLTVPEKSVYVCGDNRTNSLDSRYFGPVEAKDIVGKLALRVYPFGKSKVF